MYQLSLFISESRSAAAASPLLPSWFDKIFPASASAAASAASPTAGGSIPSPFAVSVNSFSAPMTFLTEAASGALPWAAP
ncbi:hypothetical protein LSO05_04875 (plasmid) [Borrelia sp. RT1S]|nr:hypothetical protein [Borrelia sp. RT1S]UGQ17762.1 hypothetical protein LSO05_04875 [Borrelia sp. RT1S]